MRTIRLLLVLGSVAWMVACGSGGSGNNVPSSTITSVTVTCTPATIQSSQTSQCSATVTGTGNFSSAVTWRASAGTISAAGLFTAPVVSVSTPVTITATSTQDATKSGTANVTVNPIQQVNNIQPIVVDAGPPNVGAVDEPFTSVTVCVPNTTTCQTIDHILVDTGSSGLRLLSSAGGGELTIPLPPQNDSSGNPLAECLVFLDGFTWGNVAAADITMAGEKAASVPVQVIIPSTGLPAVPKSCSSQTTGSNEGNSVSALGANGILGVGLFQQDCGQACVSSPPPNAYYDCPSSGCNPTTVTLTQQVSNPVIFFASDKNGVLIQLPAVPNGGSPTVSGSLIFGIGTQSNNALGSATVYTVSDSTGDFTTTFDGNSYPQSFIDSGSNGFFFPNATGIPVCPSPNNVWYCPTSADNLTATNQGVNGNKGTVSFTIENANTLFSTNNTAFSTLGGPAGSGAASSFDWGLPFFFGRNVFTAIENEGAPGGTPPYFAY